MTAIKENKKGLTNDSDNCILISRDAIDETYRVLRMKEKSHSASVMFTFENETQAMDAGLAIARAIGGIFLGTDDPRKK